MMSTDDNTLVRRTVDGDRQAFGVLVERYEKVVFNVAYRMVGSREDAEDITQATFLKAFEKLGTFDPGHKFFSWLYRIAVNESLNLLSRRKERVALDIDLVWEGKNPEEQFARSELSEAVQRALMRLKSESRQVLVLRHFAALPYREIAAVLDIPETTIKSRLFAARRELRALLLHRSPAK